MTILSDCILTESKSARDNQLERMSDEVVEGESQPNLFVHSLSQAALSPGAITGAPEGGRTMNAGDRSLANR